MSNSEEEEIARNYICFGKSDCTILVLDATCLERNLNLVYQTLEITPKVVICVNLLDEAKRKGIDINLDLLEKYLGVPVCGTIAQKKKTLNNLMDKVEKVVNGTIIPQPKLVQYPTPIEKIILNMQKTIELYISDDYKYLTRWIAIKLLDNDKKIVDSIESNIFNKKISEIDQLNKEIEISHQSLKNSNLNSEFFKDKIVSTILFEAENICTDICKYKNCKYSTRDRKIDKILTSKLYGLPIMILFLGLIFWITISGANYPSKLLSSFFGFLQIKLTDFINIFSPPEWVSGILIDGVYSTVTWVISVMLPPMAIFFPLFTLLEDLGFLPRIAFNLDKFFRKACTSGKQALTMCMGFGCNAAGVTGARIIDSPREKIISILTNSFVPCNGRFPFLIAIAMIFIGGFYNRSTLYFIFNHCCVMYCYFRNILNFINVKILV